MIRAKVKDCLLDMPDTKHIVGFLADPDIQKLDLKFDIKSYDRC
jgi:hypothetical protein